MVGARFFTSKGVVCSGSVRCCGTENTAVPGMIRWRIPLKEGFDGGTGLSFEEMALDMDENYIIIIIKMERRTKNVKRHRVQYTRFPVVLGIRLAIQGFRTTSEVGSVFQCAYLQRNEGPGDERREADEATKLVSFFG